MKRFNHILLGYNDGCDHRAVLERGISLALKNKARLTVVDVLEDLPGNLKLYITQFSPEELLASVVKERSKQLEAFIAPAKKAGVDADFKIFTGKRFIEIIREAIRGDYDLVMTTAAGKQEPHLRIFDNTTLHLLRKCPMPVWVVKPVHHKPYARIIAAVDPEPQDEEKQKLNIKILELATSLAKIENSELHIVHAWKFYGESRLGASLDLLQDTRLDMLADDVQQSTREWLENLLKGFNLKKLKHKIHLVKGDAEVVIPALAKEIDAELIVMGTVARTGISGFFIGNTAENILNQIDCSVLAVKPDGFISPVK